MQQATHIEHVTVKAVPTKPAIPSAKSFIAKAITKVKATLNNETTIKILLFAGIIALLTVAANLESIM